VSTAHRGPDICRNIFWMRPLQCGGRWALPRCVGRWPRKANIKWRIAQPFSTAPGAGAETHRVACGSSGFVTVEYVVFSFQSISRVRVPKKRGVGSRVLSTFCRRAGYWQFNQPRTVQQSVQQQKLCCMSYWWRSPLLLSSPLIHRIKCLREQRDFSGSRRGLSVYSSSRLDQVLA